MSTNSNVFCTLCKYSNNSNFICPHSDANVTDLNQTIPIFVPNASLNSITNHGNQGLQEFPFFGNDDTLAWLFHDSSKSVENEGLQQQQAVMTAQTVEGVKYNYLALEGGFRNSCNRRRLTFDVSLSGATSSSDSLIGQSSPVEVPTTSNIVSGNSLINCSRFS